MKADAPFRFARDLWRDLWRSPGAVRAFVAQYQNVRSWTYPCGHLPGVSILDLVPDAPRIPVVLQDLFERPIVSVSRPQVAARETASTTLTDSYYLALLVRSLSARRIIEVGTSFGESALLFALNSPEDAQVTTLDIQTDNPTIGSKYRGTPVEHKVQQKFCTLTELAGAVAPRSIDFIFIDGDHSFEGVCADSAAALGLMRSGGLVCWHDHTFRFRHDVVRALDALRRAGHDIVRIDYSNLACCRRP